MGEGLTKTKVLVVEDEEAIRTLLTYNLEQDGFIVSSADNGEEALIKVDEENPDIILLDWMLPLLTGVEVCVRLRANDATSSVPIIMLTARGEESDRVKGLELGADDYITKPFSPKEVIARIHAVLRRTRPVLEGKTLECGGLEINMLSHKASHRGADIHLGPKEFDILCYLMERPGMVFTREQLLDEVWGNDVYVEARTVDVHIRRLRKAMGDCSAGLDKMIRTIRSAGYTIEALEL